MVQRLESAVSEATYNYFIAVNVDYKSDHRIYAMGGSREAALEAAKLGADDEARILIALPASDQLGIYLTHEGTEGAEWVILDEIAQLNPELRWCPPGEVPPGEE